MRHQQAILQIAVLPTVSKMAILSGGMKVTKGSSETARDLITILGLHPMRPSERGHCGEMEVPNGKYQVRVATGEAKFATKKNTINIEGKNYWDFQYLNKNEFGYINAQIEVTDGRLSIDNGSAPQKTTKIAYLEITDDLAPERSP